MSKIAIRVSQESEKSIKAHAKVKGIDKNEAADALIATGAKRLSALARYNKAPKKGAAKASKSKRAAKSGSRKAKAAAKPRVRAAAKRPAAKRAPRAPRPKKAKAAPKARPNGMATPAPSDDEESMRGYAEE